MTALELTGYTDREFSATPELVGETVHVRLTGNADMHAVEPLNGVLDKLHVELLRRSAAVVIIDVRQLEFMNSSCLKAFVSWIATLQELPQPQQYHVQFLSNPELRWQRRSLHALACFAVNLVSVEA